MGISHSKVDVATIEAIELNVSSLIIRLGEEEIKVDDYVKHRISKALVSYSNVLEKEKRKGYISKRKMQKMRDLIAQAQNKLGSSSSVRRSFENTEKKSLKEMKTELLQIEKQMNNNKINEHECSCLLNLVRTYCLILEADSKSLLSQEQEHNVSILFLKLFLRSPVIRTVNVLKHALYKLNGTCEEVEMVDEHCVTVFNNEEIKKHLQEIKARTEALNQRVNMLEEEVKAKEATSVKQDYNKSNSYAPKVLCTNYNRLFMRKESILDDSQNCRYKKVLNKLENDLLEYESVVEKFCSPTGDGVVKNLEHKVVGLLNNHLMSIPDEEELRIRKKNLFDKATQIVHKLGKISEENKQINEHLKVLAEFENNLTTIVESDLSFNEKRKSLEALIETVKKMNTNNGEVLLQKTAVINRMEGSLVVECMFYLRQVKKSADNHGMYAQQFPYPRNVNLYGIKTDEIRSLKKCLDDLPKGNEFVDKMIQIIGEQINEVLEVFEEKVKYNEEVISALESLENILAEITSKDQQLYSKREKLQEFNAFRKRLNSVSSNNHRVLNKKMEILCKLHALEEQIYSNKPELQELKLLLNEQEKSAQQLVSSEVYKEKREEMLTLLKNAKASMRVNNVSRWYKDLIETNFDLALKLLENFAKDIKDNIDRIQSLENVKNEVLNLASKRNSVSKKLEFLEQSEGLIKIMRKTSLPSKVEVSAAFDSTEKLVAVEKSKIQLSQMGALLEKFAKDITHPMDTDFFRHKLNEILHLKEYMTCLKVTLS